ncbi:MAG: HlyD family efflux transporter periplasmic adaptor subunit [Methanomassiliicoccaceae archaeon]|nr:HlyD family efflux transporter periplasmic adaptor subunit [Methanomassiliicoccaceae archaeon]
MRKLGEYDLKKLSDSRLLYMRSPPKFTYIFVVIVAIILAGALIWSAVTVKAEQVQVSGIITTEGKQTLSANVTGIISDVYYEEGDAVSAGDVIAEFDKTEINIEIAKRESLRSSLTVQIECINTMQLCIVNADFDQPFTQSEDEIRFYYMFETYVTTFNSYSGSSVLQNNLNTQTLSQLTSERSTLIAQRTSIQAELDSYNAALARYDIKAVISGVLHLDSPLRTGMMIQAGTQIGSISDLSSGKIIEMYIWSGDRSKIEVGQECSFTVDGLAQTEYGSIKGVVRSISSDAIMSERGAFFRVIVEFDTEYIEDSKGNKIILSNGMTVRAWITYDKITYLKYWLDQIGIGKYLYR